MPTVCLLQVFIQYHTAPASMYPCLLNLLNFSHESSTHARSRKAKLLCPKQNPFPGGDDIHEIGAFTFCARCRWPFWARVRYRS